MRGSEAMTREVRVANPKQSIQEAAATMAEIDAGVIPVGENDRLVGMLKDREISVCAVAKGRGPETPVENIMSKELKYCFEDEEVSQDLRNLGDLQLRRLPVLDNEKGLIGILSLGDLATKTTNGKTGQTLSEISQPGGQHSQTASAGG